MLTPDLVMARRRKGALTLPQLSAAQRDRAHELATQYLELARAHIGLTRDDLAAAWSSVRVSARERKLAAGIRKLVDDGCEFEAAVAIDASELRRQVFELAAARRRDLEGDARLNRDDVVADVARERNVEPAAIEAGLYGDLKGAHVLQSVHSRHPEQLIADYDLEQARAVLLRATRVTARIADAAPDALRDLFRKLKFHRLLHTVTDDPQDGLRIDIDGPFSLFESVTKYGLALAMALPALTTCGAWSIEADLLWGKRRERMSFSLAGEARSRAEVAAPRLRSEVQTLLDRMQGRTPWSAEIAGVVLELPGVGLCVPDLQFTHQSTGEVVYLEVLGFWSRDAVWKRVELVEAGLAERVLFAVSSRLRVSERALDDESAGALYLFKNVLNVAQIEAKLDALARVRIDQQVSTSG